MSNQTPAAHWREKGEPDPHGSYYDRERAELPLGNLTDDELANEVFMWGDHKPSVAEIVNGTAKMPIVYLTAGKERIRWLSRKLIEAEQQHAAMLAAQADHQRLVRDLDVLLNGEAGAAKQASLCGLVAQVAKDGVVAKARFDATLAALQKYEEAFDLLFGQCCSNGIFDAWGKRVNCTTLNEAHELAGKAIKTAAPAAKDNV
ncbi:hypothetical protein ST4_099 [Aeromonas phage ST4]|nr:hypothetical protein ST4_099 [Aeromonas phage ST4]